MTRGPEGARDAQYVENEVTGFNRGTFRSFVRFAVAHVQVCPGDKFAERRIVLSCRKTLKTLNDESRMSEESARMHVSQKRTG